MTIKAQDREKTKNGGETMMQVILIALLIVTIIGWLKNRIALLILCHFMQTKNYPPPSDEELRTSSEYVLSHLVGVKSEP